jgi:hypothetical protein
MNGEVFLPFPRKSAHSRPSCVLIVIYTRFLRFEAVLCCHNFLTGISGILQWRGYERRLTEWTPAMSKTTATREKYDRCGTAGQ